MAHIYSVKPARSYFDHHAISFKFYLDYNKPFVLCLNDYSS